MKLLLVEDNTAMQTTLQRSFERRGMQVVLCGDGSRALDRWLASVPDVVLLDLSLPGMDGLSVLAAARARGLTTPVLIITGADDYLAKPFDLGELEARVRALARRSASNTVGEGAVAEFCGLRCDAGSSAVYLHGKAMDLTVREAALLRALLARPGHAVAKERLSERVFEGEADVQADAIEVVVYRLRKKLSATAVQLVTLRGLGYLLKEGA